LRKEEKYKIAVWILSLVVILEGAFLFIATRPKKIPKKAKAPAPVVAIKGKIAIVIDDWGYNLKNLSILEEIKYPLTVSVLPSLSYSRAVSSGLKKKGFEIILHLPMEPHERYRLERDTIMVSMQAAKITEIIGKDLASVQNVSGVSNHMGSRATEDERTMEIIFRELKKRGLYFLDSLVSGDSVAPEVAEKIRLKFARRNIFLDNEEDPVYIKGQLEQLKAASRLHGRAIGIGHDRRVTLQVLKEQMPLLEKEGYRFVFVSELVE
jgi:hypothetical protein